MLFRSNTENVTLTKLKILNEEIRGDGKYINTDISCAQNLYMHERDKSFTLEFAALNYENNPSGNYFYRLKGFDDTWIKVPADRRFASYTNLRPGKYIFEVKYIGSYNGDNENITRLNILIKPFFYKTIWFIGFILLILALIIDRKSVV